MTEESLVSHCSREHKRFGLLNFSPVSLENAISHRVSLILSCIYLIFQFSDFILIHMPNNVQAFCLPFFFNFPSQSSISS